MKGEGEGERERERRGEKKGERDREKKRMRYHKYNSYYKIITEITNTLHIVVIVSLLKASHHATNGAGTRNKVYTKLEYSRSVNIYLSIPTNNNEASLNTHLIMQHYHTH